MKQVSCETDNRWINYYVEDYTEEIHNKIEGKYLIFSPVLENLEEIARNELSHYGFYRAKTSKPNTNFGRDYMLCLYDVNESRISEVRRRIHEIYNVGKEVGSKSVCVKYKKNEETESGIYSNQFRKNAAKKKPISDVISTKEDLEQLNRDYERATAKINATVDEEEYQAFLKLIADNKED